MEGKTNASCVARTWFSTLKVQPSYSLCTTSSCSGLSSFDQKDTSCVCIQAHQEDTHQASPPQVSLGMTFWSPADHTAVAGCLHGTPRLCHVFSFGLIKNPRLNLHRDGLAKEDKQKDFY